MSSMDGKGLYHNLTRGNKNASSYDKYGNKYRQSVAHGMRKVSVRRDIRYLHEALQRCKIALMQNAQLVLVPDAAECGDIVCMAKAAMSPFLLRPRQDGCWSLVSGDCYIFESSLQSVSGIATYIDMHWRSEESFTIR